MNKEDICFMPAFEMAEKIKSQALSSVEITEILIERIEKINPIINAYCTTTFNMAREMAKIADEAVKKGKKLGLLNGIPASIKDLTMIKGVRTTFGSKIYENFIPDEDSVDVNRLRNAGCVFLGKTNTPEFGWKGVTQNLIFGETKNPWNLERTSGGSSGGAASGEASGLSTVALGSDGGGSIRIPSSHCGLYGLKPSYGRIPLYPRLNLFGETLAHPGPIVRYVKDAALMLDVLKGPHDGDKYSLLEQNISYLEGLKERPNKLKIGFSLNLGFAKIIHPEVEKAVTNSVKKLETLGWDVEKAKFKRKNPELSFLTIWTAQIAYDFKPMLNEWKNKMDPGLVKAINAGLGYSGMSVMKAMKFRKNYYEIFHQVFKKYDILITPTTAVPAFELGVPFPAQINGINVSPTASHPFTFPFNLTGHPAASIPCGWSTEGLPMGMQIVGRRFDELTVLQVSKAFEKIQPWQDKRPVF